MRPVRAGRSAEVAGGQLDRDELVAHLARDRQALARVRPLETSVHRPSIGGPTGSRSRSPSAGRADPDGHVEGRRANLDHRDTDEGGVGIDGHEVDGRRAARRGSAATRTSAAASSQERPEHGAAVEVGVAGAGEEVLGRDEAPHITRVGCVRPAYASARVTSARLTSDRVTAAGASPAGAPAPTGSRRRCSRRKATPRAA